MLTGEMTRLIRDHTAGMVATVNEDGTPAVSPKATFVVFDEQTLAFGNLRSPGTLANIRRNAAVEGVFHRCAGPQGGADQGNRFNHLQVEGECRHDRRIRGGLGRLPAADVGLRFDFGE